MTTILLTIRLLPHLLHHCLDRALLRSSKLQKGFPIVIISIIIIIIITIIIISIIIITDRLRKSFMWHLKFVREKEKEESKDEIPAA